MSYSNIEKSIAGNTMTGDVIRHLWMLPLSDSERRDVNHIAGVMREPRVAKMVKDIVWKHVPHISQGVEETNSPVKF